LWATGFAAGFTDLAALVAFGAGLADFAAAFEAVAFEPAAFAEVLAVFKGIALLLFFEDFAAEALVAVRALLTEVRARLLVAPRLAADAFFEVLLACLEELFLRVFCDTACARNRRAPVRVFTGTLGANRPAQQDPSFECAHNSTFPAKINDLCPIPHL
jgi:hypothetical protein